MSRKQKELEIRTYAIPPGFRSVYDDNYILKEGDLFGQFGESIDKFTKVMGLAGREKKHLIRHEKLLVLEKLPEMEFPNELNESKPTRNYGGKEYYIIEDDNYIFKEGDLIFDKSGYLGTIGSWRGRKYEEFKNIYSILSPIENKIILPEIVINFNGRKLKRITDENYILQGGEFLFKRGEWDVYHGIMTGHAGKRFKEFSDEFNLDVFIEVEDETQIFKLTKGQKKNEKVPENFEILGADELIQFNDYYWDWWGKEWIMAGTNWKTGRTVENRRMIRFKLSPEQKIEQLKKKAKLFVQKNIRNATEEDFKKFETVFLRDDNFGL